jgi:type III pantothenate kinase
VELVAPNWTFGQNTQEAIIGGLVYGAQGALRRLAEAYATQMGAWPLIIATGGDAELVCGNVQEGDLIQAIVPDLSLRGVAMAYYRSLLK